MILFLPLGVEKVYDESLHWKEGGGHSEGGSVAPNCSQLFTDNPAAGLEAPGG